MTVSATDVLRFVSLKKIVFSLQLAENEIRLVEAVISLGVFPFLVLSPSLWRPTSSFLRTSLHHPFTAPPETWPGDQPAAEKQQKQRKYNKLNSLPHCSQQNNNVMGNG